MSSEINVQENLVPPVLDTRPLDIRSSTSRKYKRNRSIPGQTRTSINGIVTSPRNRSRTTSRYPLSPRDGTQVIVNGRTMDKNSIDPIVIPSPMLRPASPRAAVPGISSAPQSPKGNSRPASHRSPRISSIRTPNRVSTRSPNRPFISPASPTTFIPTENPAITNVGDHVAPFIPSISSIRSPLRKNKPDSSSEEKDEKDMINEEVKSHSSIEEYGIQKSQSKSSDAFLSNVEDIEKEDDEPTAIEKEEKEEKEDDELTAIEKEYDEPTAIEKEDDEPKAIEKEDDEPTAIEKEDDEPKAIEKEDDEPKAIEKEDDEPTAIEKEDDEPTAIEKEDDEPTAIEKEDDEPTAIEKEENRQKDESNSRRKKRKRKKKEPKIKTYKSNVPPFLGPVLEVPEIPDYSSMSTVEQAQWREEFRIKFGLLRSAFRDYSIPDIDPEEPLEVIHARYERYIRHIHISGAADSYRNYLILMFLIIELLATQVLGLPCNGYTMAQMRSMSKYERLLIELGEKWYVPGGSDWPVEYRIIFLALFNALVFMGIKWLAKYVGEGAAESLVNAVVGGVVNNDSGNTDKESGDIGDAGGGFDLGSLIGGIASMLGNNGNATTVSGNDSRAGGGAEPRRKRRGPLYRE